MITKQTECMCKVQQHNVKKGQTLLVNFGLARAVRPHSYPVAAGAKNIWGGANKLNHTVNATAFECN